MPSNPVFVMNIDRSRAVGLTAYLTPQGFRAATEMFRMHKGYQKYEGMLSSGSDAELASLRLDEGVCYTGFGSCRFHGKTKMHDGQFVDSQDGFHLGYRYVARIVSSNGDVWQNWLYDEYGNSTS